MAVYTFNDNFQINAPKHIDTRYINLFTPYVSPAAANALIPMAYRYLGLTVLIGTTEYWYQAGITDPDLVPKLGGGGGTVTADNGLTMSIPTNVQLGGTLLHDTTIDTGAFFTWFNGNITSAVVNITNSNVTAGSYALLTGAMGAADSLRSDSVDGNAIVGAAGGSGGTGTGVLASGINGSFPLLSQSDALPSKFVISSASTTGVINVMQVRRTVAGVGVNGIGGSIEFYVRDTVSDQLTNSFVSTWSNTTHASRVSQFVVTGVNNAVTADLITLAGAGELRLNKYGAGTFTGTPTKFAAWDATGNFIEIATGGGTVITADNGLTISPIASNVELGGTLIHNTTIDATSAYSLNITGSKIGLGTSVMSITNTDITAGPGTALLVTGTSGAAITATTTDSYGLIINASGVGGIGASISTLSGGLPLSVESDIRPSTFILEKISTSTIEPIIELHRTTSGGGAFPGLSGIGGSLDFYTRDDTQDQFSNSIASSWATVTNATRTSQFDFYGVFNGTTLNTARIDFDGQITSYTAAGVGFQAVTSQTGVFVIGVNAGVIAESPNVPLGGYNTSTSTNTPQLALDLGRQGSSYVGAIGNGISIHLNGKDSASSIELCTRIDSVFTDVTPSACSGKIIFYTTLSGALTQVLVLKPNGVINITQPLGNFVNNAAAITGGLTNGDIYRNGDVMQIVH